jgi:hypothetical protein
MNALYYREYQDFRKESLGYYELKSICHDSMKGAQKFLDQRKQAKLQWLQDPSIIKADNLKKYKT